MTSTTMLGVRTESDILLARQQARTTAESLGFTGSDLTLIATAVSEIARNIVVHAGEGNISISEIRGPRNGIEIVARDSGPGIVDLDLAMRDGYSTVSSLGLGLPGAKRLMHEFEVENPTEGGLLVVMRKWVRR
jgi:serine/threonine-protein kinase RsbT